MKTKSIKANKSINIIRMCDQILKYAKSMPLEVCENFKLNSHKLDLRSEDKTRRAYESTLDTKAM